MFVVGITALARSLEEELPALAADLGVTAFDARQMLAPGLPAIVLLTAQREQAVEVVARLRARGNEALAFDGDAVVSSADMVSSRRFRLEADALVAADPPERRLPYADIAALLRATHRTSAEGAITTKTKQFSMGRAVLTGGLVMRKTKETSARTHAEDREGVLYVFRRSGETPWLLREHGTRHEGLGERMAPTERANFLTTVELLRERAPGAACDDRLVNRKVPERIAQFAAQTSPGRRQFEVRTEAGIDLLAHLLAAWFAGRGAPAR